MSEKFLYRLARILPGRVQGWALSATREAGLGDEGYGWLSKTIIFTILGGVLGTGILYVGLDGVNMWLNTLMLEITIGVEVAVLIGFFLGMMIALGARWWHLYFLVERRRSKVEEILPDFLLLVAGNIRAGMTSFSAFKSSARPEFGPLSQEIKSVTSRSLGIDSFASALSRVTNSIRSQNLDETIRFFLQAARSGGKMATLLENTSAELRQNQELKKELQTSTRTYVIFVGFVMMIATPMLMAVSVEFIELVTRIQGQASFASGDVSSSVGFLGGTVSITADFLVSIAYILLFGNAFLASLFMGTIGSGKPFNGVRWAPVMFLISVVIFLFAREALGGLLVG